MRSPVLPLSSWYISCLRSLPHSTAQAARGVILQQTRCVGLAGIVSIGSGLLGASRLSCSHLWESCGPCGHHVCSWLTPWKGWMRNEAIPLSMF